MKTQPIGCCRGGNMLSLCNNNTLSLLSKVIITPSLLLYIDLNLNNAHILEQPKLICTV